MSARALHYLAPLVEGDGLDVRRTLCGKVDLRNVGGPAYETTDSAPSVTCRWCVRRLVEAKAQRALGVVGVALGAAHPGAHASKALPLDRVSRAILERSIRGEPEDAGPRWSSIGRALEHEARVLLDGSPVRSSSDADRFGVLPQRSVGEVPVPQAIAGREDVIAIRLSIRRACEDCAARPKEIGCGLALTAGDFELVLRWLGQGEPAWQPISPEAWKAHDLTVSRLREVRAYRKAEVTAGAAELEKLRVAAEAAARRVGFVGPKGGIWRLSQRSEQDVAWELGRRHGVEVTTNQVEIARKAIERAFAAALRRTGELRAPRPRKEREVWDPSRRLRESRARQAGA